MKIFQKYSSNIKQGFCFFLPAYNPAYIPAYVFEGAHPSLSKNPENEQVM